MKVSKILMERVIENINDIQRRDNVNATKSAFTILLNNVLRNNDFF